MHKITPPSQKEKRKRTGSHYFTILIWPFLCIDIALHYSPALCYQVVNGVNTVRFWYAVAFAVLCFLLLAAKSSLDGPLKNSLSLCPTPFPKY